MNMEEVLAANYKATTEFNPDQVAEANALSSSLQIDPRFAFDELKLARDAVQQPNWTEYARRAPGSAQYLSDPANMAVSRDDTQGLLSIEDVFNSRQEKAVQRAKEPWKMPEADWAQGHWAEVPTADMEGAPKDLSSLDSLLWQLGDAGKATVIGKRVSAIGNQVADGNLSAPEAFTLLNDLYKVPEPTSWVDKYIARGFLQFIDQRIQPATDPAVLTRALATGAVAGGATAWATAATGPLAPVLMPFTVPAATAVGVTASYTASVLASMRMAERGQAMVDYLNSGIPAERAAIGAEVYGLFATATEATGLGFLYTAAVKMGVTGEAFKTALKGFIGEGLKSPGLMGALGKLTGHLALGAAGEAGTEAVQQTGQDLIGEWQKYLANQENPELSLKYKTPGEIADSAAETFATTFLPAMLMAGLPFAHATSKTIKAHNEAQTFAEHHQTLNDAVQGSLTKERSPDKMEAVLNTMGLRENGYLSPEGAETLLRTLSEEEGRALASRLGIDYEKSLFDIKEGREIPISMATLHAQLSKEEFKAILPDLRPASGEFSQREAIEQGPAEEVARKVDLLVEENDAFHKLLAAEEDPLKTLVLLHGSGTASLTLDDINIDSRSGHGSRGGKYGGFYALHASDVDRAARYADASASRKEGGKSTIYELRIDPKYKVYDAQRNGEIERLSKARMEELRSQGYGVMRGKDITGNYVEYAVIDKAAILGLNTRTEQASWRDAELNVSGETHPAGEVIDHLNEQTSELEKLVECLR